uniref:Uncharacterized protein n=1 Tax=Anguilla anguilla TaxID=7936 RepID=A0A0E9PHJ7_ANGAN
MCFHFILKFPSFSPLLALILFPLFFFFSCDFSFTG